MQHSCTKNRLSSPSSTRFKGGPNVPWIPKASRIHSRQLNGWRFVGIEITVAEFIQFRAHADTRLIEISRPSVSPSDTWTHQTRSPSGFNGIPARKALCCNAIHRAKILALDYASYARSRKIQETRDVRTFRIKLNLLGFNIIGVMVIEFEYFAEYLWSYSKIRDYDQWCSS